MYLAQELGWPQVRWYGRVKRQRKRLRSADRRASAYHIPFVVWRLTSFAAKAFGMRPMDAGQLLHAQIGGLAWLSVY